MLLRKTSRSHSLAFRAVRAMRQIIEALLKGCAQEESGFSAHSSGFELS